MDQDKLYELIDNIPVTQENAGLIEEIKEDIATTNYTAALEKIEMLGSKRTKKTMSEPEEQQDESSYEEEEYEEDDESEDEDEEQIVEGIYPRELSAIPLERQYIGLLLTDPRLIKKYYFQYEECYFENPELLNVYKSVIFTEGASYSTEAAKRGFNFARDDEKSYQLKSALKREVRDEDYNIENLYIDLKKLFVLRRNYLAIPVIIGKKTEKEKFAGAEASYSLEAMMYDGVALQNGTSHYFGDGFAKAFGIEFLNKENKLVTPFQTSWGVTTRMIGSLIMVHGDDRGLVIPPNIAPTKVMIIPIGDKEEITDITNKISDDLKNSNISFKVDNSNKTPGFKFAEAEVKGYPVRIEIGMRDLENNEVTIVRRDTLEKIKVKIDNVIEELNDLFPKIQDSMYEKALKRRDEMIYDAKSYEEFTEIAMNKPGFIKTNWCGDASCEEKIKDDFSMKSRCLIEDEKISGPCVCCGKEAKYRLYFGRQY